MESTANFCVWNGETFSRNGLLVKSVSIDELNLDGIIPSATEMKRFKDCRKTDLCIQTTTNNVCKAAKQSRSGEISSSASEFSNPITSRIQTTTENVGSTTKRSRLEKTAVNPSPISELLSVGFFICRIRKNVVVKMHFSLLFIFIC